MNRNGRKGSVPLMEAYDERRFPNLPLRVTPLDKAARPAAVEGRITVGIGHR